MAEKKAEKLHKVMALRGIWVEGSNGKARKVPKGSVIDLPTSMVKHFGDAVTRNLPLEDD